MLMPPRVRAFALTAHITSSVGWLGAAGVFFTLGVIGWTSPDEDVVRATYLVMEPAARFVLLPLGFASLLTGLVQALGTTWGLFRHYWVIFKLLITAVSVLILWSYLGTFRHLADVAADPRAELATIRNPSPMLHAGLALLGFLVAVGLSVYKPRGITRYGQRRQQRSRRAQRDTGDSLSTR